MKTKTVRVFDTPYTVKVVDTLPADMQAGEIDFESRTIVLAKRFSNDKKISKQQRTTALVHELVHAALFEMKHQQYKNEKLVTPLAIGVAEALTDYGVSL